MKIKEVIVESDLQEKWSNKYKRSIDCSHPKGFSQRAHCQGRKKKVKEELIFEDQKFDFEGKKPLILQFINGVLSNKLDPTWGRNVLYGLIVGDLKVGAANKLGLSDQFSQSWKKYFQRPEFGGDSAGPWSQINIGDKFTKATGDDRTLNFYVTVVKEKNNIAKFLNNIYKLGSYLQPISQKYQTPIKFKTHTLLDNFIGHNDSLKVYYYDPKVKDLVVNATRKWLSDSAIVTGTRSHEHGVDLKSGGGSFGEILSNNVYNTFTNLIKTNGTKFTPEQYFEWLKKNLSLLISQVKQKETIKEGDIVKPDFSRKSPYTKNPDIEVPTYNGKPFDHFELEIIEPKRTNAHIIGIINGERKRISTAPLQLATVLVDAYNRGGFTDVQIGKVPVEKAFRKKPTLTRIKESNEPESIWNSLDEGLSLEDKMFFFEQYHSKKNLKESVDKDKSEYFLSLSEMSDPLVKDKNYIVVPLALVANRIIQLNYPRLLTFVKNKDKLVIFKKEEREFEYPSKIIRDTAIYQTFTFETTENYDKFRVALSLKFDFYLPEFSNKEELDEDSMSLHDWFGKGKHGGAGGGGWDRYNTKGERIGKCGERSADEGKPKCLSKARAASLRASGGKKAIGAAVRKKRREDPNPEKHGKAEMVSNKTHKSK